MNAHERNSVPFSAESEGYLAAVPYPGLACHTYHGSGKACDMLTRVFR